MPESIDIADKVNRLSSDPDFLKLPDDQQKAVLQHTFTLNMTPGDNLKNIDAMSRKQKPGSPVTRRDMDFIIDMLRPMLASGAAAGATAISGPAGVVTGPAAYTGTDYLMQKLKSEPDQGLLASTARLEPGGVASNLANTAEQFSLGKVGESVIGGAASRLKTLFQKTQGAIPEYSPTTSQALKAEGHNVQAAISKFIEDHFSPGAKEAALNRSGQAAYDVVNKEAGKLAGRSPNTVAQPHDMATLLDDLIPSNPTSKLMKSASTIANPEELDKVIANPDALQAALTKAQSIGTPGSNLRADLKGYQLQRMLDNSTIKQPAGGARIDADIFNNQFTNPGMQKSLGIIFNKTEQSNIKQFIKNISLVQDKMGSSGAFNRAIMYGDGIALPMSVTQAFLKGSMAPILTSGGTIGVQVSGVGLAKLLTNPKTSRLMVNLAAGSPLNASETWASKAISQVLQGTTVGLINRDGSKTEFKLE